MATVNLLFSLSISRRVTCFLLFISMAHAKNTVVFQPSYLTAVGPTVRVLLLGNTSNISLNVRTVSASSQTGSIGPSSCVSEVTQWVLTREQMGQTAVRVQLRLNKTLRLCGDNEADCYPKPLVLETLEVSACVNGSPQTSLLIQAKIHVQLFPANASDNSTAIPNLLSQTLGSCPCDHTFGACDVRCCCDKDCSNEELKLFESHCLLGPFGGHIQYAPDYQCSVESSENSPDWFPFLCVTSPPENNPYLGSFYQGAVITPKPGPSFKSDVLSAPVPANLYIQGSPIFTLNDQYFKIPQRVLGECVNGAPVAFLKNFDVRCATLLHSCPTEPPLKTTPADLKMKVKNGLGGFSPGETVVDVIDEVAVDLSPFITRKDAGRRLVCENVTLALDYTFHWKGNGITNITLKRYVGTIAFNDNVELTTRYSAMFLNGEFTAEPNTGNPGYQVGRPVIGGILDTSDSNTSSIQRMPISFWKPVNDGLCSTSEKKTILFGENSTSGCLLPVGQQNLTQCNLLRETVFSLQEALIAAKYIARHGNPDPLTMTDWVNITFVTPNLSAAMENDTSSCYGIPSHQHIHVWSLFTGIVDGIPHRDIQSLQVSYSPSSWALNCGGGDVTPCLDSMETRLFPITSSVTFMDIPTNTAPPKSRFQINFTEYDCNRNDVCWPELLFPITRYYTGEPYAHSLAKGLILVFIGITASILGNPWRQFQQAWIFAAL